MLQAEFEKILEDTENYLAAVTGILRVELQYVF